MNKRGFTLIELLVVIAIIGLLSTIVLVSLNSARAKTRDAKRLIDMKNLVTALYLYYNKNGSFPGNTDNDCSGWDTGYYGSGDIFINPLQTDKFFSKTPGDPTNTAQCGGYRYYRYSAGNYGCDSAKGNYFVLGATDMETSGRPYKGSPGWSCSGRNWQTEFDWVVGGFEK